MRGVEYLAREELEEMNSVLLDLCLEYCGAQFTEAILRNNGFGDAQLEAVGFDVQD